MRWPAKMAFPDRTVIACMGDGAMQMNGLNVMITISKYWKQWSNPRLIVLVLNNRDLNQVTWEERVQLGAGKTELTQSIPDFPYHKYAELIGLKGIFVDDPDQVGAAWDEALSAIVRSSWRPIPIPMFRRLPPHITLKDAKNFMFMMRDEPELGSVLKNSAKELLDQHLARKGLTMRVNVPIEKVRAQAFTIPTDKPEADGTIAWNSTTLVRGRDFRRRYGRPRLHLFRRLHRGTDRVQAGRDHRRAGRLEPAGRVARDAARGAQSRPRRPCCDGDLRGRYRTVRSEGAHPRRAAGDAARRAIAKPSRSMAAAASRPIPTSELRRAAWRLGDARWLRVRQDEGWHRSGRRPAACRGGEDGHRQRRRCSSMPTAPTRSTGSRACAALCRPGGRLVRRAGIVR